ncbi:MAG: tetratricopeptide repeat protein [Lachnospiraceae bacterium]|nr:tetratricopeptide repeat protein [Lachnospiraceae bacterium]
MKNKKSGLLKILLSVLLVAVLSGCGNRGSASALTEGMQYIEAMDYNAAMNSFAAAQANGENPRLIARGMGIASMGLTDYEAAIEYFLTCLGLSNGMVEEMDYDVNYYLAAAYQKAERYGEAETVYDAILALRPGETDAYYLRGNARLSQGEYQTAKEDFDKVISLEPTNFNRLIQVYEVLAAAGYKQMGQEYLETALAERSDKMSAYDRGRINYFLGNYEQAQVLLEQAKDSGGAESYLYLGMAYEATGDYNYAITNVYNSFLSRGEGNAEIYNQLGLCYLKQGEYASALQSFQNAMQMEENSMMQVLRFNEIVAYEYLGEYTQAAVLLDNYLKTYPDDAEARREYSFLSTR